MAKKEIKKDKISGTSLQGMDALSPGGDLQAYINSVHSIGVLTREEEKKLAEDLYYRNDLDAARKLVRDIYDAIIFFDAINIFLCLVQK